MVFLRVFCKLKNLFLTNSVGRGGVQAVLFVCTGGRGRSQSELISYLSVNGGKQINERVNIPLLRCRLRRVFMMLCSLRIAGAAVRRQITCYMYEDCWYVCGHVLLLLLINCISALGYKNRNDDGALVGSFFFFSCARSICVIIIIMSSYARLLL